LALVGLLRAAVFLDASRLPDAPSAGFDLEGFGLEGFDLEGLALAGVGFVLPFAPRAMTASPPPLPAEWR
jgi:hypothetical protein